MLLLDIIVLHKTLPFFATQPFFLSSLTYLSLFYQTFARGLIEFRLSSSPEVLGVGVDHILALSLETEYPYHYYRRQLEDG